MNAIRQHRSTSCRVQQMTRLLGVFCKLDPYTLAHNMQTKHKEVPLHL